jgi:CRP-like cAMP-binding protein
MAVSSTQSTNEHVHPAGERPFRNLLLTALTQHVQLAPFLERVEMPIEQTLYETDAPITHCFFPQSGVVSFVKDMTGGTVEVGTVGPEGMIGISALLGVRQASTRMFTQSAFVADRIDVDELNAAMEASPGTRDTLLRYVNAFHEEVALSVACNRLHSLEERCARWLLMTHDRTGSDVISLKQRFLSYMLGVHRPAVSLAAGALQRAGIIRYSRGTIRILDRAALEKAACECYELGRQGFVRARLAVQSLPVHR